MSSNIAIAVQNLSKKFRLKEEHNREFNALNNVSFTVNAGDVVGIIGNNGSGKSTLLKILSQISKPSSGEVRFYGTVTSILEVGTNFNPDLTGRENVVMQLHLAEINKREFDSRQQSILAFSEIGEFYDQPVKHYSSGMFLRLAFAVAFHLAADIFLLDEVISVGDEGFRLKCQDMLRQLTQQGKTILFVSHNRLEILELGNKCIWLEKGRVRKEGNPAQVLSEYFALHRQQFESNKNIVATHQPHIANDDDAKGTVNLAWDDASAPGNEVMVIRQLSVLPASGEGKLLNTRPFTIKFVVDKKKAGMQIGAFFFLQDVFYQPVMVGHFLNNHSSFNFSEHLKGETGLVEIECTIPPNFLTPGKYYLLPRFGMEKSQWNVSSEEAFRFSEELHFTLHAAEGYVDLIGDISKGSVRPPLDWQIKPANL